MTKRHDPNFIKNSIESAGWVLHEPYINARTKMRVTCDNGHKTFITWDSWQSGSRCKCCAGQYIDPQIARDLITIEGWILHDEYKNAITPMAVTCPNGHNLDIKWLNWRRGIRCKYCAGQVVTHDFVQQAFELKGYTLLSKYVNSSTKLDIICPKGHRYTITWSSFNGGSGCNVCAGKYVYPSDVKDAFTSEGYILHSEYTGCKTKMLFTCPKGHNHSITWNDWQRGSRCVYCSKTGFNPDKSASLYYLRFDIGSTPYYKIGITNRTIKERYIDEPLPYTILKEDRYLLGSYAKQDEAAILKKHKRHLYKGPPLLFSGNTELFTKDVLKLDKCQTKLLSLSI